jgi:hypothetical protein
MKSRNVDRKERKKSSGVTIMKILHLVDMKHSCDHRGMREGYLLV